MTWRQPSGSTTRRSAKSPPRWPTVQPHPVFGAIPHVSGHEVSMEELHRRHWAARDRIIFRESAIPADLTRQKPSYGGRSWYVDELRQCRTCEQLFIFFAVEQKYWYEDLGIPVDVECLDCVVCRKKRQAVRAAFSRWQAQASKTRLYEDELRELIGAAVELIAAGVVLRSSRLSAFVGRVRKTLDREDPARLRLERAWESITTK